LTKEPLKSAFLSSVGYFAMSDCPCQEKIKKILIIPRYYPKKKVLKCRKKSKPLRDSIFRNINY